MYLHRLIHGARGACALAVLSLAACSGDVGNKGAEQKLGVREDAIIAGVDAKSTTLNAVGTLVLVQRYSYCSSPYGCGYGGASAVGGMSGVAGTGVTIPITRSNPMLGRLGRMDQPKATAVAATGGATGVGGASNAAGGGTRATGGRGSSGGATGFAGSGAGGGSTIEVVTYSPFCTATLVGPTAVLSAEHCLQDLDYYYDVEVAFAVGPNATSPTAVYPIVDWDAETAVPNDTQNLLSELGSDVGIAHLGTAVTGITPLAIGSLTATDVASRFTALGYGIQDNTNRDGTRKAGSVTYRGNGGNYADYAFGGLQQFLKIAPSMPAFSGYPEWYLEEIYNELNLIPDYQGFFGGKSGDAQPCYGDSGGPIIATRNGVRTLFGLITNGFGSNKLICDYGVVAAIFGPLTQSYLEESLKWTDPCEGISDKGYCGGDIAIRCTNRLEGARRLSETDCALLGQTCGLDETGTVACVDQT